MTSYNDFLYNIPAECRPKDGEILISRPFLDDSNFRRAVVLMVDCEGEESLGIILNRGLSLGLNDAISGLNLPSNPPLFLGGPVAHDRLMYIHTLGPDIIPDAVPLTRDGLYIGGDYEAVLDYIRLGGETEGLIKFAVGYSGWHKGQLEAELEESSWAVSSLSAAEILTGDGDAMWRKAVRNLDERYNTWKQLPSKLSLN